jgi:hypothetical protein
MTTSNTTAERIAPRACNACSTRAHNPFHGLERARCSVSTTPSLRATLACRFGAPVAMAGDPREMVAPGTGPRVARAPRMKKSTTKLSLRSQTIRLLQDDKLAGVVGGTLEPIQHGFIMKDSIIIKTSTR